MSVLSRRRFLELGSAAGVGAAVGLGKGGGEADASTRRTSNPSEIGVVMAVADGRCEVQIHGRHLTAVPIHGFPPGYTPQVGEEVVCSDHRVGTLEAMPLVQIVEGARIDPGAVSIANGRPVNAVGAFKTSRASFGPHRAWLTSNVRRARQRVLFYTAG